jgi:hypothetical protein
MNIVVFCVCLRDSESEKLIQICTGIKLQHEEHNPKSADPILMTFFITTKFILMTIIMAKYSRM